MDPSGQPLFRHNYLEISRIASYSPLLSRQCSNDSIYSCMASTGVYLSKLSLSSHPQHTRGTAIFVCYLCSVKRHLKKPEQQLPLSSSETPATNLDIILLPHQDSCCFASGFGFSVEEGTTNKGSAQFDTIIFLRFDIALNIIKALILAKNDLSQYMSCTLLILNCLSLASWSHDYSL